ncbi:hypothetical protein B0T26DRAFT_678355 [Lasiosphaeria miniovina]|uniref:Uncharacterized protein n=1 Tax=Lasiosphaeria miniovina TaxID=1954250 RepID=A0AA40AE10_9PEZI|nr:uncharacterized protein B0T26DRAFT_678355 [Lasiosphaeria miniovina]KAK0714100.1 hypothetical protein B0T26DRAFT_678355 [Lasiosphaeria miniovina]
MEFLIPDEFDEFDEFLFDSLFKGALVGEIEFDQADILQCDRAEFEHALAAPTADQLGPPSFLPEPAEACIPGLPAPKPLIVIPPGLEDVQTRFFRGQETITFSAQEDALYCPFLNNIYTPASKEYTHVKTAKYHGLFDAAFITPSQRFSREERQAKQRLPATARHEGIAT